MSQDGSDLLLTGAAAGLLDAVTASSGGIVTAWRLDHVDSDPGRATTATFRCDVRHGAKAHRQTIGATIRANGPSNADRRGRLLNFQGHQVSTWIYPDDPDLPGLRRAASATAMAELLRDAAISPLIQAEDVAVDLIGYRPRRRAVLRVRMSHPHRTVYVKVLREAQFDAVRQRHEILWRGGVPSPRVLATTADRLLVIAETPGQPLARAIFANSPPVSGRQIVDLLDAFPAEVADLERRPPWAASVAHYAGIVEAAVPRLSDRLAYLVRRIDEGLASLPLGNEPTHGDFYEAQIFVAGGSISGLIDVDTIGPGRRADDLACLVAHLNCIQRMNPAQARQIQRLLERWVPVFDHRVDPVELRLRSAAVVISLATGPYRGQEQDWEAETVKMIEKAEDLVARAERASRGRYGYR